jgi:hypothetical protein
MSDYTREELEKQWQEWNAALAAVSTGSSYTIDNLTLTRADLFQIMQVIKRIRRELIDFDVDAAGGRQGQRVPVWS